LSIEAIKRRFKQIKMLVSKAIETGKITLAEIIDFMNDELSNADHIKKTLSEITGYDVAKIEAGESWDSDSILSCEIIDVTPY